MPTLTAPRPATTRQTAAALRKTLRSQLPGTTIHVTTGRGSSADWIHLTWTDGPTTHQVRAIASAFESERFDGRDDNYRPTSHQEWSCAGIRCERTMSPYTQDLIGTTITLQAGLYRTAGCPLCLGSPFPEAATRLHFEHTPWTTPAA